VEMIIPLKITEFKSQTNVQLESTEMRIRIVHKYLI